MIRLRPMLRLAALPLLALPLSAPAGADTLADIRVELGQLAAEFNTLRNELSTTGASASVGGGDALRRMDTIESELSRLTARTEEVELKLNRVVSDGTNRIGDIEFRLCEATPGCDPMNIAPSAPLGGAAAGSGGSGGAAAPKPAAPAAGSSTAPELALSEKADFDRAKEVLGQGDFQGAATLFATYAQSYPGGPLVPEANFLRGEALRQAGQTANAGRAYVEAYSADPKGQFAGDSLLKLGQMLGQLGQMNEACMALGQVGVEYPGTSAAAEAPGAMQGFGCP